MKRQRPQPGDIFSVGLSSSLTAYGQVLSVERDLGGTLGCALWDSCDVTPSQVVLTEPLAVLLTTPDSLRHGLWVIVGNAAPAIPVERRPWEKYRRSLWVGAEIIGSGNVRKLLEAANGLRPWDAFHDPRFLDGLLYSGRQRPERAVLKGGE